MPTRRRKKPMRKQPGKPKHAGAEVGTDQPAVAAANILDALSAHIALLDRKGVNLIVNEAWRRFAPPTTAGLSGSVHRPEFFQVCRRAASHDASDAGLVIEGLTRVLRAQSPSSFSNTPAIAPARSAGSACP
jgi:hypothetical protein